MSSGSYGDPAWIRLADRCYGLGLSLFSSAHRAEYGDLMRQAFRDRCREVARGERSAWRSFAMELAPDLISSIGGENMNSIFGDMRPRHTMLLALLGVSSAYFVFGEALGLRLSDLAVTVSQAANRIAREREAESLRARFHGIAEPLAAESTAKSKALAALMYRHSEMSTGWISPHDEGDHAHAAESAALSRAVLAGEADAYLLAVLARQCWPHQRSGATAAPGAKRTMDPWSCDLESVTRRMLASTPDNGYVWALEYKLGVLAKNPARMRRALAGLAAARYYNAYEGHIASDLLAAVARLAPGDAQAMESVASAFVGSSWSSMARLDAFCDPSNTWSARFGLSAGDIELARVDCVKAGRLIAQSTGLYTALRGWELVAQRSLDPSELSLAEAGVRELESLREQVESSGDRPHRSTTPFTEMWIASYPQGQGEIPSIRRWLAMRGTASRPPASQ